MIHNAFLNCYFRVLPWLCAVLMILLPGLSMVGCGDQQAEENPEDLSGEALAKRLCTGCHRYSDPSMLPKTQWTTVLDRMALHLGIPTGIDPYKGKILEEVFLIQQANVFYSEPAMSDSAWQRLVNYYLEEAPDTLPSLQMTNSGHADLFRESFPPVRLGGFPVVTMVEYDDNHQQLYVADLNNQLVRYDAGFTEDQVTGALAPVVDITPSEDGHWYLTEIGFLDENDQKAGLIEKTDHPSLAQRSMPLIELIRPVHLEAGDIDGDGQEDLIVCSFGNLTGDLSWHRNQNGRYIRNVLRDTPGAIQSRVLDFDDDGDLDIIALFGQAEEGVSLFVNNRGTFEEVRLLEFDPVFGCSSMEVVDFDDDGDQDLILVNGDNSDYSFIPKPYHGIRIFENLGKRQFTERRFIPMYGATGVLCRDFDRDGDLDLFAHAFYPDFVNHGGSSLLYLENLGQYEFSRQEFDLAEEGRWLVADAGDLDRDGDLDIFVGSFALGPGVIPDNVTTRWRSHEYHLLYLENQLFPSDLK